MGRTIVAEESVQSELSRFLASQHVTVGLLIGQVTEQKDYVAFAMPTPPLIDGNKDNETPQKRQFQHWWVIEHSKQVTRLLPGGLEVVGVLLCCQSELLKPLQSQLTSLLRDVCSQGTTESPVTISTLHPHSHRVLLHSCSISRKQKCQTIDLADSQAGFQPAELKFQAHSVKWHRVECPVTLHTGAFLPASATTRQQVQQSIQSGLNEMLGLVSGAVVSAKGRVVEGGSPLVKGGGLKKLQQSSGFGETVVMEMFIKKPLSGISKPTVATHGNCRELKVNGCMQCFAYVHPKATCQEATTALKQDAARSLQARFSALCEDMSGPMDKDEKAGTSMAKISAGEMVHEFERCQLPRRVELVLPSSPLHLCDYCLPREGPQDCLGGVKELIGIEITGISVQPIEKFPDPKDVPSERDEVSRSQFSVLGIAVAATVVLLAVILWAVL